MQLISQEYGVYDLHNIFKPEERNSYNNSYSVPGNGMPPRAEHTVRGMLDLVSIPECWPKRQKHDLSTQHYNHPLEFAFSLKK